MAITTYGDISQRTAYHAMARMLSHAEPVMVLQKFGEAKPIPKNKSQQVKWRRMVPYALATTPLTEGTPPSSKKIVYEDVAATLGQYGDLAELTDVIADQAEDPVLENMSQLAGEQASETIETLIWSAIKAGTSVIYTNGTARNQVNTVLDNDDVRSAVRFLLAQRAKRMTSILAPSVNISTKPVEPAFIALGHTDLANDIRNLTGFIPVAEYGNRSVTCAEEIGATEDMRFVLSPVLTPWIDAGGAHGGNVVTTGGTSADVYPLIVVGKEAFGISPLKGKEAITPMVLNPNVPRGGDPLGQKGSVAWKTYHVSTILNDLWMARIEVGASVLKTVNTP